MSYQVLARKWRPRKFAEVVGQDHVVRTLQNALAAGRVAHAYLFVGPRGTGKTTTARIFAKALNCETGMVEEPCGECDSCRRIAVGNCLDVVEIDGASHNKVEDIRELRENVQYTPSRSRFKIYIIDEVHMLTNAAWNALLKTLEEPPPHVKFFFATTEPHKVLATILSRCQRFDLRRLPAGLIAERLKQIADSESVGIDERALHAIARAADGGMRDGQSIFDQIISYCGGNGDKPISEEDVISVFGLASGAELKALVQAIVGNDPGAMISLVQDLADRGRDLERVYADLMIFMRDLMVVAVCRKPEEMLETGESETEDLWELARLCEPWRLQRIFEALMEEEGRLRAALNKRVYLEAILIKVMRHANSLPINDLIARLNQLRRSGVPTSAGDGSPTAPDSSSASAAAASRTDEGKPPAQPTASPAPPSAPKPEPKPAPKPEPKPEPKSEPKSESRGGGAKQNYLTTDAQAGGQEKTNEPNPVAAAARRTNTTPFDDPPPDRNSTSGIAAEPDDESLSEHYRPAASPEVADEIRETQNAPSHEAATEAIGEGSADEAGIEESAELWHRLIEKVGEDQRRSGLKNYMQEMRPISYLGDALIMAYDNEFPEEHARLLQRPVNLRYLEGLLRRLTGCDRVRLVVKRWDDELSDVSRPRLVSSPEVRQKLADDPFVRQVIQLFGGELIDARG